MFTMGVEAVRIVVTGAAGATVSGAGVGAFCTTGGGVTSTGESAPAGASALWAKSGVDERARAAAIAVMPGLSVVCLYIMPD
jgi:hypothetical protein